MNIMTKPLDYACPSPRFLPTLALRSYVRACIAALMMIVLFLLPCGLPEDFWQFSRTTVLTTATILFAAIGVFYATRSLLWERPRHWGTIGLVANLSIFPLPALVAFHHWNSLYEAYRYCDGYLYFSDR